MSGNKFILLLIILILVIWFFKKDRDVKEGISQGALTQLYAKGPMDTYLTGDAWKYIPWWYYSGYYGYPYYGSYSPWYNSTYPYYY